MAIGERIRLARKASGQSQRALAKKAGISAMAVSKYERAMDLPGSAVLLRIGRATGVGVEYFFRPSSEAVEVRAFRRHSRLGAKQEAMVAGQVQEWLERHLETRALFPSVSPERLPRHAASTLETVERAAEKLREAWSLGLDPIENLIQVLEDHDVAVGLVEGADKFDACTFEADGTVVIAVKRRSPGDRQRFSLAHELGHLVVDVRGQLNEEDASNRFAGALLVPAEAARAELGERRSALDAWELLLLKRKYGLSMQGWIHRAHDLGIITANTAAALYREFRYRGWHRKEPGESYPSEEPTRLKLLVAHALAEDMISPSRAAELLATPVDELRRIDFQGDLHARALVGD